VQAVDDAELVRFPIPDSHPPVGSVRLHSGESGWFSAVVRFPRGWLRDVKGAYAAAEEFVLLDGTLEMNGLRHAPGSAVRVPQHGVRWRTESPDGALALAWFSGSATWERVSADAGDQTTVVRWDEVGDEPSPLATPGRRLWRADGHELWFVRDLPAAPAPADVEVLALDQRAYAWVERGHPLPQVRGAAIVRVHSG
jgi:hypothetical protein